ncbi:hypothetical protein SAMN05428962_6322 [Paenibacillus sp. BC26]|nr:hypothetical protein SAMN05428962_6322 [Paenibacillus sp. BC26]
MFVHSPHDASDMHTLTMHSIVHHTTHFSTYFTTRQNAKKSPLLSQGAFV